MVEINWPTFSVVIPTYRRHQQLCQCLEGLAPYFDPAGLHPPVGALEVIVSDDGHDEELRLILRDRYPWCRYTEGPNRGPAANRNHGANQAKNDWLAFTDDDCLTQPGWIENFARIADHYDVLEGRTSAASTRIRVDEECPINETGGYLWSCNFAIRRECFFELGGFNEHFPAAAMEDVELNRRINKAGLRRKFVASAEVRHAWRQRKGRCFLRAKAGSIAAYVSLHPEVAKAFATPVLFLNLLRSFKATFATAIAIRSIRGLPRQICLEVYAAGATWRALRQP